MGGGVPAFQLLSVVAVGPSGGMMVILCNVHHWKLVLILFSFSYLGASLHIERGCD